MADSQARFHHRIQQQLIRFDDALGIGLRSGLLVEVEIASCAVLGKGAVLQNWRGLLGI